MLMNTRIGIGSQTSVAQSKVPRLKARSSSPPAIVRACSGPMMTAQWPLETALLLAIVLIAEAMLSRMPSGSLATWFVTLCGGSAASTKTVESCSSKPLSTW